MTSKSEELEAATVHIEQMHDSGALPAQSYYKCLVTLASSHLCEHLNAERALVLLNKVPANYYLDTLPEQMREDGLFAQTTVELSYRLVQLGLTGGIEAHVTNMKEADA